MKLHGNARTCLHGRRLIVERRLEQGWTLAAAAEAAGVSVTLPRPPGWSPGGRPPVGSGSGYDRHAAALCRA
jgi:hypothetical protein